MEFASVAKYRSVFFRIGFANFVISGFLIIKSDMLKKSSSHPLGLRPRSICKARVFCVRELIKKALEDFYENNWKFYPARVENARSIYCIICGIINFLGVWFIMVWNIYFSIVGCMYWLITVSGVKFWFYIYI